MIVIRVENIGRVKNFVNKLSRNVPAMTARGLYNTARFGASELKKQAYLAGLKPWGGGAQSIFKDTEARKMSSNRWDIFMPIHGIWQDRARPHPVPIRIPRGRRLVDKWAISKGFSHSGWFWFEPKPFINKAFANTVLRAEQIMREEMDKLGRAI